MSAVLSPPEQTTGRRLGDVNAVAGKCDCSPRHIYRMADAGKMPPPVRLGSLVRWDLEEIDRWIAAGCPSQGDCTISHCPKSTCSR